MSFAPATVERGLRVSYGGDENLFVEFYHNPEHQKPFARITIPGDKTTVIDRLVKDSDKDRWPRQWEAFERGAEQISAGGTPLEMWPVINKARLTGLHAMNVWTVEQIANMTDGNLAKIGMDGRKLQQKARELIKDKGAPQRVDELEAQNRTMQEQLAEVQKQLAELSQKRKPGRPKKVQEDVSS